MGERSTASTNAHNAAISLHTNTQEPANTPVKLLCVTQKKEKLLKTKQVERKEGLDKEATEEKRQHLHVNKINYWCKLVPNRFCCRAVLVTLRHFFFVFSFLDFSSFSGISVFYVHSDRSYWKRNDQKCSTLLKTNEKK